jgi:hypothetical protein
MEHSERMIDLLKTSSRHYKYICKYINQNNTVFKKIPKPKRHFETFEWGLKEYKGESKGVEQRKKESEREWESVCEEGITRDDWGIQEREAYTELSHPGEKLGCISPMVVPLLGDCLVSWSNQDVRLMEEMGGSNQLVTVNEASTMAYEWPHDLWLHLLCYLLTLSVPVWGLFCGALCWYTLPPVNAPAWLTLTAFRSLLNVPWLEFSNLPVLNTTALKFLSASFSLIAVITDLLICLLSVSLY